MAEEWVLALADTREPASFGRTRPPLKFTNRADAEAASALSAEDVVVAEIKAEGAGS